MTNDTNLSPIHFLTVAKLVYSSAKRQCFNSRSFKENLFMTDVQSIANKIVENVERVIVGKKRPVQLTVLGLLCQGHLLIEDVPGVGKTVLAKSLSKSVGCDFQRIQFTPDMLPSDVTGVSVFNQKTYEFEFRPGPIHAQIVLVDEINRATRRDLQTGSSLYGIGDAKSH
jgi:MoxR-like ATPase